MLPKLNTPAYTLELPSTKEKIKYRPFLVGEEKILLLANETGDEKELISAIKQIIQNCTFETVDPEKISLLDFEYLFLNLRMKSKGEFSEFAVSCKCGNKTEVSMDLSKYEPIKIPNFKIELSENIGVKMKLPTFEVLDSYSSSDSNYTQNINLIKNCMEYVYDNDTVTYLKDISDNELEDFINSMTQYQFSKIKDFIDKIPQITYKLEIHCNKCKEVSNIELRGLQSFFG